MDVARINGISPAKIDWRRLTAKEIIKYEQQGVEVPTQYIQWAQEFLASLNSDDETTYEMAASQNSTAGENTKIQETNEISDEEGTTTPAAEEPASEEDDKNAAQKKRQEMEDNGASLISQGRVFTKDSKENSKLAAESASMMKSIEEQSTSQIQELESYMSELLSKAEEKQRELKSEVSNINDDKNDKSSFGKINQLQKELEQLGSQGQSTAGAAESDFNAYQNTINDQSSIIQNTMDFGAETVDIGNELINSSRHFSILRYIIGKKALKAGENAESKAMNAESVQSQALSTNSANLSSISGYKIEIENKTGVAGVESPKEAEAKNEDTQTAEQGNDKHENTAQNDGNDTTAQASAGIDEILKRKIRRGENIETS